ncbi:hypothetical protein, partial [Pseudomonas viridiflava]|uniref:hypothetical protein n=1 Tax=Pseudomonas viridiflava TaxID=33069 RepID=UPI0019D11476
VLGSISKNSATVSTPELHPYLGASDEDTFEVDQDGDDTQPTPVPKAAKKAKPGKTTKAGKPQKAALDDENDESGGSDESNQSDEDDDLEALLSEMDEDYSESELEELEALQEELHARAAQPSMTLANKLATVGHDFPVTGSVPYSAKLWPLAHGAHAHPNNIRFDRELSGSNDLKRALTYHTVPEFSPFS